MPFTIGGEWVSPESNPEPKKALPVKVRNIKRKKALLTVIYNIGTRNIDIQDLAKTLKRKLGIGGCVKGDDIELQGHKADEVKKILTEMGVKVQ